MKPFTTLHAIAAPLPIANIDTDQIIPKQFLTTVAREGLSAGLFYDMRFDATGAEREDFVLNQAPYKGAQVLITGQNFGCGSSREHAPWALLDFGISCVIASSFADIFYDNCFNNGVLPAIVEEADARALMGEARGGNHRFTVDLATQTITAPSGARVSFRIDPGRKDKLLRGLDSIGLTLQRDAEIIAFEARRPAWRR